MTRLKRGECEKIDNINDAVVKVQSGDAVLEEEGMTFLLDIFKPLLLTICKKWSIKYNNGTVIIGWNDILADIRYWMWHYTKFKYEIDGQATYNNFIQSHLDSRVRYIYQSKVKDNKRYQLMKEYDDMSNEETFETYTRRHPNVNNQSAYPTAEEEIINNERDKHIEGVLLAVKLAVNNMDLSERDEYILKSIIEGKAQTTTARELDISKQRIIQLTKKLKARLYDHIDNTVPDWEDVIYGE